MSVLFLFIDGIGLGSDKDENPFYKLKLPGFYQLCDRQKVTKSWSAVHKIDHIVTGVDACLGVDGLPQSGTGQVGLFTGKNAAKTIGKHFGPFPHSGTKPLLKGNSLFKQTIAIEKKPFFVNAYPPRFFQIAEQRNRWSTTTLMCKQLGLALNTVGNVEKEQALTAEIKQDYWREKLKLAMNEISEKQAAQRLIRQLKNYDLVLYEYFLTDKAGHSQNINEAEQALRRLDHLIGHILEEMESVHSLVLCSDHGNLEDLSTKTHTRNEVPLLAKGSVCEELSKASSILDVSPAIVRHLKKKSD